MFSCEFCEISKSTFFSEHLWVTTFQQLKNIWNYYQMETKIATE